MYNTLSRCTAPMLAAYCLFLACLGGCSQVRHGVLMRGSWSMELNRVPWLSDRNMACEEISADGGIGAPCLGPDPSCPCTGGPGGPEVDAQSCEGSPCLRYRTAGRLSRLGARGGKPICYNHSRFHPVPSRPVFSPRIPQFLSICGETGPEHLRESMSVESPPSDFPGRGPINVPNAPEPEVIPTPSTTPGLDGEPRVPKGADTASQGSSWVFNSPVGGGGDSLPNESSGQRSAQRRRAIR